MGRLNLTYFDSVLKDQYEGPIRSQLNNSTVLMKRAQKTSEFIDATGRKAIIPILYGNPQAIGARGDRAALPTSDYSKYDTSEVTVKSNYGRIEVTGKSMRASRNNAGAFTKAVDSEIQNMVKGLKKDINRQMITGDANGILAYIESVPDANSVVVYRPGGITGAGINDATMFCHLNMLVDSYTSTAKNGDSATISAIDESARDLTIATHSMLAGDTLHREDNYSYEMMGLRGVIDDSTVKSTLQAIDSSTLTWWRSKRYHNSGELRDVNSVLMQGPYSYCEKQGDKASLMLCSFDIRDSYAASLEAQRRIVNSKTLDGGFEYIEFHSKPVVPDADCPTSVMFFVVEAQMALHVQSDFHWSDEDGNILSRMTGYDSFEAFIYYDAEYATFKRNAHAVLYDLK